MRKDNFTAKLLHRLGQPVPERVVILRALQLGDLLCAVPAFRAIRAALPRAEIVLVGLPWARAFVDRYGAYLDGFREFPGYPGLPERVPEIAGIPAFLTAIQHERFDLALQMHGSGSFVNSLTVLFGARRAAGFYLPGDYCPEVERFLAYPERGLEIRRLLQLVAFLGMPPVGEHLEFPLQARDHEALRALLEPRVLHRGAYVCLHPGASVAPRCWPADRFAAVARVLAARGFQVVLTGTAAEADLTRAVGRAMGGPYLDLAARTDLGALAALLTGARLLVCNDTGVSHLAAALSVPSVVIATGNNPERWAPINGRLHRVLCRDAGVPTEEVIAQVDQVLSFTSERLDEAPVAGWQN